MVSSSTGFISLATLRQLSFRNKFMASPTNKKTVFNKNYVTTVLPPTQFLIAIEKIVQLYVGMSNIKINKEILHIKICLVVFVDPLPLHDNRSVNIT